MFDYLPKVRALSGLEVRGYYLHDEIHPIHLYIYITIMLTVVDIGNETVDCSEKKLCVCAQSLC